MFYFNEELSEKSKGKEENIIMYTEDDFVMLSALQHFMFCPRQCALIHIEQAWDENVLTAEGRLMHERAHDEKCEMVGGVRIERGVSLQSFRLGLTGKADVIEYHKDSAGVMIPFPIEYKRGKPKKNDCDKVQLCAQALCLEEMLSCVIKSGAIFYGKTRRRLDVIFDEKLRTLTVECCHTLHSFLAAGLTPKAEYAKRCESCSLYSVCKPKKMQSSEPVEMYLSRMLIDAEDGSV